MYIDFMLKFSLIIKPLVYFKAEINEPETKEMARATLILWHHILFHLGKANTVVDTLIKLSMESLTHIEEDKWVMTLGLISVII